MTENKVARNTGGPAFPTPEFFDEKLVGLSEGMSLRDYFAAKVLDHAAHDVIVPEQVARRAYSIADAMIAERAQ